MRLGLLRNMATTYHRDKNNLSTSGANATKNSAKAMKDESATASQRLTSRRNTGAGAGSKSGDCPDKLPTRPSNTAIAKCVQHELRRYFDLLDGEEPSNVYHLVMRQAEHALIESVMQECGGNQSKATKWLGISRGNLRNKLADMGYD
jgi:Fis family transcriptional regulator